jgi:predicted PurR-regulated permease PerM
MYCIYCGAGYPENAAFCPVCGKSALKANEFTAPTTRLPDTRSVNADIRTSSRWIRRVAIPLMALTWIVLIGVLIWAAAHISRSLLLLAIAALLAFALAPLVTILGRFMPRIAAILITYLIVLSVVSILCFFLIRTAILQTSELRAEITALLRPDVNRPPTPLETTLQSLGIDQTQIQEARQVIVSHLSSLLSDAVPILRGVFDFALDVIVVAMLSIYFLIDGSRIYNWLRKNLPLQQERRGLFLLDTMQAVVGGYIRGQLTLSLLIGFLVGIGMFILRVPHPILLGELAFLLAFVPVLGTFISAVACILLAFTATSGWVLDLTHQNWVLAIIVLIYFIAVHLIESHIVGPRIVGHAVGLHPIISISALIAGSELFGILGALFVAPVVGVIQAIIVSFWREWRAAHPDQFPNQTETEVEPAPSDAEPVSGASGSL